MIDINLVSESDLENIDSDALLDLMDHATYSRYNKVKDSTVLDSDIPELIQEAIQLQKKYKTLVQDYKSLEQPKPTASQQKIMEAMQESAKSVFALQQRLNRVANSSNRKVIERVTDLVPNEYARFERLFSSVQKIIRRLKALENK